MSHWNGKGKCAGGVVDGGDEECLHEIECASSRQSAVYANRPKQAKCRKQGDPNDRSGDTAPTEPNQRYDRSHETHQIDDRNGDAG
jgi:hypothetical protein